MKKNNLRVLAMMLLSMMGLNASAHDIAVANADGVTIYYNYSSDYKELVVTYRGDHSDSYNKYSGNVVIPDEVTYMNRTRKVTSIGEYAFYSCSGLTSITIPNSVTSIVDCAFSDCSGLTSVTIGNSVTSIGHGAFWGCSGLTSVTIPNSVTSIRDCAFQYCSGLTSVTIGNSVTSIGKYAFQYCSGLTSVTIPNSVTSIGRWAFSGCSGLTSLVCNATLFAYMPISYSGSYNIPDGIKEICGGAFYGCSGLTSVTIPNSVTSIGTQAFGRCSGLTSVTIPNNVTSIGNYAFDGADLSSVVSLIENPFAITGSGTDGSTFSKNTFLNATLYVPKGTIEKYQSTDGWKDFLWIEERETKKCATPTISIVNGELEFSCETEGIEYQWEITVADAQKGNSSKVSLTGVYKVSVYATKDGYEDSDVATAEFTMSGGGLKGDVNTDGTVNALDIQEVINIAAAVE